MSPSSGLKKSLVRHQHEACSKEFMLVSSLALTRKIGTVCSSETLVYFQQSTWHYIPEDISVQ
jgi:hypothetical protein